MARGEERALRRRIRSIQSTKKITRAMELIAATRVTAAQQRAASARPYSEHITAVIQHLAEAGGLIDHPLLRTAEGSRRVAFVVISSDRGLAGPYNANVIRVAERELQARRAEGADYSLVFVGRKAESYFRFRGYKIDAAFSVMSDRPSYECYACACDVAALVRTGFEEEAVDQVILVYTRFISLASQRVVVRQFLPLTGVGMEASGLHADYEFEPAPGEILARLLPRYVETRLYAAMLEAAASEHASRQRAMKAATDNAEELIVKFTRAMNRARQDAITTEIMEIVGGAEALRAAKVEGGGAHVEHALRSAEALLAATPHTAARHSARVQAES